MQENKRYFAASNSSVGFKNYFGDIFSSKNIGRIYILKGGPGPGKSRFMREVAEAAEGVGLDIEYFYCSSDPDSLDGVLIGNNVCAVIDGTAPHSVDPIYPGAVDEIINLGEFWNEEILIPKRDEIISLSEDKKKAYRDAYRFLEASGLVRDDIKADVYECVDMGKLRAASARLFSRIPEGEGFERTIRIQKAIGMHGEASFDTFEKMADKVYYILDTAKTGYLMLGEIYKRAKEKRLPVICSFSPLQPDELDGLYLPKNRTAFCIINEKRDLSERDKMINMGRFIKKEQFSKIKGKIRFSMRCHDALLDEAKMRLNLASEAHFKLEKIYISAMDFDSKEKATKEYINKILDYCEKMRNMVK